MARSRCCGQTCCSCCFGLLPVPLQLDHWVFKATSLFLIPPPVKLVNLLLGHSAFSVVIRCGSFYLFVFVQLLPQVICLLNIWNLHRVLSEYPVSAKLHCCLYVSVRALVNCLKHSCKLSRRLSRVMHQRSVIHILRFVNLQLYRVINISKPVNPLVQTDRLDLSWELGYITFSRASVDWSLLLIIRVYLLGLVNWVLEPFQVLKLTNCGFVDTLYLFVCLLTNCILVVRQKQSSELLSLKEILALVLRLW